MISVVTTSTIVYISLATASAMVLARAASLASWSWLWSLLVLEEVAASPSLVLSLFPIMLVRGCMVLQEIEVSQIIKCSFVPYIQLCCAGRFCSNLCLPFKSHFKSIKNKLSSYVSIMLWQMVSKEV